MMQEVTYGCLTAEQKSTCNAEPGFQYFVQNYCESPSTIDDRMRSIVDALLGDADFAKSWNQVVSFYGKAPSIVLANTLTSNGTRTATVELPSQSQRKTLRVIAAPDILCAELCFPALATLGIVETIYSLHINLKYANKEKYLRDNAITHKIVKWALRNEAPGKLLDLASPTLDSALLTQNISPSHKIVVGYKAASRTVAVIAAQPLDIFLLAKVHPEMEAQIVQDL